MEAGGVGTEVGKDERLNNGEMHTAIATWQEKTNDVFIYARPYKI